jgi:hypothetical protein
MKMTGVLMTVAVVLVVIGAGLSYVGYNESLQNVTLTSTRSYTITSTRTVASTSTESIVMTTSSTNWLLEGEMIDLPAAGQAYCGYYESRYFTLDPGQVHVSFQTDGKPVDYWVVTQADYDRMTKAKTCQAFWNTKGLTSGKSNAKEFTVTIPSSGEYYFVFQNTDNYNAVTITLDIDTGLQQTEYTVTNEHTVYSTQQTVFPTQTVTSSVQSGGVGLLLYIGIALIVVAVVVLAIGMRRGVSPSPAPVPPATPVATSAPAVSPASVPVARKFCINCGAPLPIQMVFCNKCGTKQ